MPACHRGPTIGSELDALTLFELPFFLLLPAARRGGSSGSAWACLGRLPY
jgi:hypothetical protein